jgi:Cft2 family RNA processing exonuclease
MKNEITYLALGETGRIGASSHYLKLGRWGILLDAGIDPHPSATPVVPEYERLKGQPVNAIVISHAHLDHLGSLPIALRYFPEARIYMTPATAALSEIMLYHYLKVQERRFHLERTQYQPCYLEQEIDHLLFLFQSFAYNFPFKIHGFQESEITIQFWDAGHILGSAGIEIQWKGTRMFYTGNTKKSPQFILRGAKYPAGTDILITETTYGNNDAAPFIKRSAEINRLVHFIKERIQFGGAILIPVFALGRTQEIMLLLHRLITQRKIPPVPLYLIGMGIKINKIYDRLLHKIYPDYQAKLLKTITGDTLYQKKFRKPSIILATSGMMMPNTLSFEIASDFLLDRRNGIALVGWADPETPGGSLRQGNQQKISEVFGVEDILCGVETFYFSAHSHREELISMIEQLRPRQIILCHGELSSQNWMKARLEEKRLAERVILPETKQEISLS